MTLEPTPTGPDARERFVVLGASNVSRALPQIVALARRAHGGPIEILAAHGHGRSYGTWSRVLWVRELPGIDGCGLWPVLAARPAPRTTALVTDIGNDLVYGVAPIVIAGWVERAFDRLLAARARIVVTAVPIESLTRLGRVRFEFARALLFPERSLVLADVVARAKELDELVHGLASSRGIARVTPRADWYGLDPIHVRLSRRESVFAQVLGAIHGPLDPRGPTADDRALLGSCRPEWRRWFGRDQRWPQPSGASPEGTTFAWH